VIPVTTHAAAPVIVPSLAAPAIAKTRGRGATGDWKVEVMSRPWARLLAACLVLLFVAARSVSAQEQETEFDHYRTRFPLAGAHERVACESCHPLGSFRGTPTRCAICHDGSGLRSQSGKGLRHIRSTNDCDDCHLLYSWIPSRMDHGAVLGSCFICHNGFQAVGKSAQHIPSSNDCEECHRTTSWRFDHSRVQTGCYNCHNGVIATGKGSAHPPSSNACELCHRTTTWRFDHSRVWSGCYDCHNGVTARGKSSGHPPSSNACELCHNTRSWSTDGGD